MRMSIVFHCHYEIFRTFVPSLRGARQTAEIIPIEPD
jgi:hypothetical protein